MPTPARIGRYRIERELGRGGMGVVYAGYDESLERPVAIKRIAAERTDETARRRFLREARAAARIRHPNVCHLYEVAEADDEPFIAMELLEGESLASRLERGPLNPSEAVGIAKQTSSALMELHQANLVHRDLKPSNIFLTPHGVKVLDFGLAREIASETPGSESHTVSRVTQEGALVGTPSYMAPEQLQGRSADVRSDVFALGAVLFEMLTAKRAFAGTTPMEIFHRTLYEQPPALSGSGAVRSLDAIIRRALAKRPEDRFTDAGQMSAALDDAAVTEAAGEDVRAHVVTRLIVLPFRQLRKDDETDFLSFAVPDAVTTALTGLEGLVLRSSALAARLSEDGLDLTRLAAEADVDVVLTGTLLRSGDRIRANVQLLEVPDGSVVWSHDPTVAIRDVFELQDQIVTRIVESLTLSLTARDSHRLNADVPSTPTAYELYLRANQLLAPQGLGSLSDQKVARDLYLQAAEEDPRYAPTWARLGRCHWLLGKGGEDPEHNVEQAEACFARALELSPHLPLVHNLYAHLEIDQGRARDAMVRLLGRARESGSQPELFAALVQSCRYAGLPLASLAAHERAVALDRNVVTSAYQTFFHIGDYQRAREAMSRQKPYLMDAAIHTELGETESARRLVEERLEQKMPELVRRGLLLLRGVLDEDHDAIVSSARWFFDNVADPEASFLMARYLSLAGEHELLLEQLERTLETGFVHYHALVRDDIFLDPVRGDARFRNLVDRSKDACRLSVEAFHHAEGELVLGSGIAPNLDV